MLFSVSNIRKDSEFSDSSVSDNWYGMNFDLCSFWAQVVPELMNAILWDAPALSLHFLIVCEILSKWNSTLELGFGIHQESALALKILNISS